MTVSLTLMFEPIPLKLKIAVTKLFNFYKISKLFRFILFLFLSSKSATISSPKKLLIPKGEKAPKGGSLEKLKTKNGVELADLELQLQSSSSSGDSTKPLIKKMEGKKRNPSRKGASISPGKKAKTDEHFGGMIGKISF